MLSSAGITGRNSFARALSPFTSMSIIFGPGERIKSPCLNHLAVVIFTMLLLSLAFIAALGVFVRTTIDTWIQLSLYIVPLLSLICGFTIYRCDGFSTLLERKLGRWYGPFAIAVPDGEIHESNRGPWLRRSAIKICLYPLVFELYQWTTYLLFQHVFQRSTTFAGAWKQHRIIVSVNDTTWTILYVYFWSVGVYLTGFVSYSFIFFARLTIRDAISFMCRFGESPFLPYKPTYNRGMPDALFENTNCFKKFILRIVGFLTLDLLDTGRDIVLFYEHDHETNQSQIVQQNLPDPISLSVEESSFQESIDIRPESSSISIPLISKLTPNDACRCLTKYISNLESLASAYQPFIIVLTFFSVANFITHIVAIVIKIDGFELTHWWTFARTLLWMTLAIRLLWSCATITHMLARIPMHVEYLNTIGALKGTEKEWEPFFRLMHAFQLGTKTYGFPLTIKQVASCATFLNFAFLIVLSIMHPKH